VGVVAPGEKKIKVVMGFLHFARERLTLVARHVTVGGMRKNTQ